MKSASQIAGRSRRWMSSKEISCGVHSSSINPRRRLEARVGIGGGEPRSGLGARGRCLEEGLDLVVAEAGATIACHVAAHHAFAQARLERLIDHAAVFEIRDAPLEK